MAASEHAELHELIGTHNTGTRYREGLEPDLASEPETIALEDRSCENGLDELGRALDAGRLRVGAGERVECVALDQRLVQRPENERLAQTVEHRELTADGDEHAGLL